MLTNFFTATNGHVRSPTTLRLRTLRNNGRLHITATRVRRNKRNGINDRLWLNFGRLLLTLTIGLKRGMIRTGLARNARLQIPHRATRPLPRFGRVLKTVFIRMRQIRTGHNVRLAINLSRIPRTLPVTLMSPRCRRFLGPRHPATYRWLQTIDVGIQRIRINVNISRLRTRT